VIGFMLAAGCLAVAVLHAYRLAVPPRADLVAGVGRWDQARARASRVQRIGGPEAHTPGERIGRWVAERLERSSRNLTGFHQDLAITGTTLEAHVSKALTLAAVGLVGPVVILAALGTVGLRLPVVVVPAAGIALAAVMVYAVERELRDAARRRRAEFRRTLSIYLDLVAMSMQAGRGHAEALPASAAIGTGWAFTDLRDAIDGARFSGITAWTALGELGERLGVSELSDLDGALRLANDDGAKIKATLVARAATLRAQRIADSEADANQATESMKFALIIMVFVFLAYELYPSLARLFTG
jgi:tight adherence protein C